jgi:topoisomerase IA-like protein
VNVGRFGPYIKLGEQFISIPKGEDLHEMELERAIELINEKQLADAPIAHLHGAAGNEGQRAVRAIYQMERYVHQYPARL